MSYTHHFTHPYAVEQRRDIIGLVLQRVRLDIAGFLTPAVAEEVRGQDAISMGGEIVELATPVI